MDIKEKQYKVYKHINKINNKVYIGITCQIPRKRWRNGEGYIHCVRFYNAIQKYSWDNFEHLILFDRLSKEEAEEIEIELIAYHKSNDRKFGYNIENGGNLRKEVSKETRKKLSESKKNRIVSEETKRKLREINIGKKHSEETKRKISNSGKGLKRSKETRKRISEAKCKKIICLNTLKIYNSVTEASKELNLSKGNITMVCMNKRNHTGFYKFKYLDEFNSEN